MAGSGFEAVAADIKTSAAGMTEAAETVSGADPTADLGSVGKALPGGQSAAAAASLSTVWSKRFSSWASDAEQHGTARRASADGYSRADHEASLRLQAAAWADRGPAMHRDR